LSASIRTMSTTGWLSSSAATTNMSGILHHGATGLGSSLQMAGPKPSAACCLVPNATQARRQTAARRSKALLCCGSSMNRPSVSSRPVHRAIEAAGDAPLTPGTPLHPLHHPPLRGLPHGSGTHPRGSAVYLWYFTNRFAFPCIASILRTHSRSRSSTGSAVSHASKRFRFFSERGTKRVRIALGTQASTDGTIFATIYDIL
jgi:hypothetical protein